MSTYALRIYKSVSRVSLPSIRPISVPVKGIFWTGVIALALASILYVVQIVQLTRSYYFADQYQTKAVQLAKENKQLQVSFAQNSVMESMLVRAAQLDFAPAKTVQYIQMQDDAFAFGR